MDYSFVTEYFGRPYKEFPPVEYSCGHFLTEKFRVDVFVSDDGKTLVSADLRSCFNKPSQSPINFVIPLKKRQEKRLKKAVECLVKHKEPGTLFGELPEFEEFSRSAAWNSFYKK